MNNFKSDLCVAVKDKALMVAAVVFIYLGVEYPEWDLLRILMLIFATTCVAVLLTKGE